MQITLIRHTSVVLLSGMIYGQTNVSLNNTFEQECKNIMQEIPNNFDRVYSSPLIRCKLLAQKISSETIFDNRLKELNFGDWEQKYWDDICQTPEAQTWFTDYLNTPCPAGESYQQMYNRVQSFYKEILQSGHQNICIITHGGPIRAFISIIEKITPQKAFDRKINYGEIIRYIIKN